jgi:Rne/Rng family ribonuclease
MSTTSTPSNDSDTTATPPPTTRTRTRSRSRTTAVTEPAASDGASDATPTPAKRTRTAKRATTTATSGEAAAPVAKKAAKKTAKRATKKATASSGAAGSTVQEAPPAVTEAAEPARKAAKKATKKATAGTKRTSASAKRASAASGGEADVDATPVDDVADRSDAASVVADATHDGAEDGAPTDSDGGVRPRRRRGGRGRRGRGRGPAGAAATDDVDGHEDAAAAAGSGGRRTTSKDLDREDHEDGDGEGEPRIARGGTRMAAKRAGRGRQSNGGGGGGGRRPRPGGVPEEVRRAILAGPPRTMLVTAQPQRTQIAVLEDRTLVEHYVTRDEDVTFVGNIYMGRVQNVLPGMEAAFVDIGKGRNGVLYAGEVLYDELDLEEEDDQRIENVLRPGQKVLVQVTKDPMGTKGPRLTMHLSLAGRYVVLAPNSDLFGISRKLTDDERDRLRRIVKAAKPEGHGVIVRTAAEGATEEQLTADVQRLVERWTKVQEAADRAKPLEAVYEEPKLVVKVIRDIFGPDFERCIVDEEALFDQVRDYLSVVAPELVDRIELYGAPTDDARSQAAGAPALEDAAAVDGVTAAERRRDLVALFAAFDVIDQLRQAMHRKVWLPSGGYLIIESTEAMKVIDVNTGRFTGGSDSNLEEVVLKTNLEAADEIVRQLRLRDMGGMIIIDFIDMLLKSNQDQVVRRLKRELLRDRTKTRVSDVSRLGLVQMTRKNVSQGLVESFSTACEACEGHGFTTDLR